MKRKIKTCKGVHQSCNDFTGEMAFFKKKKNLSVVLSHVYKPVTLCYKIFSVNVCNFICKFVYMQANLSKWMFIANFTSNKL